MKSRSRKKDYYTWHGPYTRKQLEGRIFKNWTYVWFRNIPGCGWNTPHYLHRITLKDFLDNYPHITNGIYVFKRRIVISNEVIAAMITGFFLIVATLIGIYLNDNNLEDKVSGTENDTPKEENTIVEEDKTVVNDKENIVNEKNIIINNYSSNSNWEWEELTGKSGEDSIKIRILYKIITDQFRWKIGSYEYLDNGKKIREELPEYLKSLPDINKTLGLIAVGMSSQENNQNRFLEEDRAERRADNIIMVLSSHKLVNNKELYKLNLGVHETINELTTYDETSYQRKIIIIGVMEKSTNISFSKFKECLRDALNEDSQLSFNKNRYSKFVLNPYQINHERIEL